MRGFFNSADLKSCIIARSALYIRRQVKNRCSVCWLVSWSVRIWVIFTKRIWGVDTMSCRSTVRVWNTDFGSFEKSGPPLCYQWQIPTTFGQVLDDVFVLFWKKLKLHIPGVFAPLPCTVYLVVIQCFNLLTWVPGKIFRGGILISFSWNLRGYGSVFLN